MHKKVLPLEEKQNYQNVFTYRQMYLYIKTVEHHSDKSVGYRFLLLASKSSENNLQQIVKCPE